MNVLIIGGIAAGTKVAAKLKRDNYDIQVTILTKGKDISYAGCGLPYYVGSVIENNEDLIVNTPDSFSQLTGVRVLTEVEVTKVNPDKKNVEAVDLKTKETRTYTYDKLIIATGADPIKPPVDGIDLEKVYFMRTPDDAIKLRESIETGEIKRAVVLSIGVRPNTAFLADTGIELSRNRAIIVNERLETNVEGRILAQNLNGKNLSYRGTLGTAIVKLPELNVGKTGLTEEAAKSEGYNVVSVVTVVDDKAHYYPEASTFIIKMIADRNTKKLLGLHVLGKGAVDKMVDMGVMAIALDATLDDIKDLDFAYAPPFSTAIHPFSHTVNVLLNKINGEINSITPREYSEGKAEDYKIIDVSISPSIAGVPFLDLSKVHGELPEFSKDEKLLLVCSKGKRGYMLQKRLNDFGYTNTLVLEGGTIFNELSV